ncbi:nucleolar and spindle-associated protein 1 isoform X6 [Capricornis sumatraensis]|uniref:nucleolar and spindle-associated protein 1 isoform X6 n=1 Tax=Capricornis sumatraensis TaxID=34865 RepID=UPI003604A42C
MIVPSLEELNSFKYSDLQNLAKNLGLRANLRDEIQTSASSCDETELQTSSQEQAEREPDDHVTKTRGRRKTVHRSPDSQTNGNQNHSEIKICGPTESQNQEKHENQVLRTAVEVPSLPNESQGDENAVSESLDSGNEDPRVPSKRKKSLYTDGFSKPGKNKTTSTTPNFKKLHEARFKEMESIDQYVERKKKHFEEHNSFNELKRQPITKGVPATPVPARGRLSVAFTPGSQQRSQGRPHAGRSTLCVKGSAKHSALSAAKMNVRFSAATKDNEHKRSLTKTPARKSPHVTMSGNTPKGQAVLGTHKLKTTRGESVAGKLKPWGQSKENNSLHEHVNRVSFHKKTYKQPRLQTREEQRKKHEQERKEKKEKVLGVRRGLIIAERS